MTDVKTVPGGAGRAAGSFWKEIGKPTLVLFSVGLVVTALLAWVYQITFPIIEARQAADLQVSLKQVLPAASSFDAVRSAEALAAEGFEVPPSVRNVYPAMANDAGAGYAIAVSPKGYGGAISMLVGVGPDGAIAGVTILAMNETPGLGTNAANPAFLGQFSGLLPEDAPAVVKTETGRKGDIQALTGATVTSRAVTRGIDEALTLAQALKEKED